MPEQEQEHIFRIIISAPNKESLFELVKDKNLSMGGGGPRVQPDGTVSMEAYVSADVLQQMQSTDLEATNLALEVVEDATKVGIERQKEVGVGDRFSGGKEVPLGFGVQREKKP